jgi:hypothetical protein
VRVRPPPIAGIGTGEDGKPPLKNRPVLPRPSGEGKPNLARFAKMPGKKFCGRRWQKFPGPSLHIRSAGRLSQWNCAPMGGRKGGCAPSGSLLLRSAAATAPMAWGKRNGAGDSAPNRAGRSQRGLPRPFANSPPTECRRIDNRGKRSWGQSPQKGPAGPRGPLASLGTPAGRALRTVPSKAGEPAFE